MRRLLLASLFFSTVVPIVLHAQTKPISDYDLQDEFKSLSGGRGMGMGGPGGPGGGGGPKPAPGGIDTARGQKLAKIAADINTLPAGQKKINYALQLAVLSVKGDPGRENIQTVTDTLSNALIETPGSGKKDKPEPAYMELARLVRYAGMTTKVTNEQLADAQAILANYDADIQKADFTLPDLNGKKVTFSQQKGKIVLVYYFSTLCGSCKQEMTDLNLIYQHYQSQGLVILALSPEPLQAVGGMAARSHLDYPVLFDTFRKATDQFHVDTVPRTFVFDRDGKLVGQSLDSLTQGQIFHLLGRAGLKPQ